MANRYRRRRSGPVLAVLSLACLTAITVDYRDDSSPFEPVRDTLGDVLGPAQERAAVVARPIRDIPGFFETHKELRHEIRNLQAENANLRGQLATTSEVRRRAAELDGLLQASSSTGLALVPARVVSMGPAQSFTHTVTIDAGTASGVRADMTVLNNQGLVGRVIEAGTHSATVLLAVDQDSVVGARLGSNAEIGMLRGRGTVDGDGRLDLDLVDNSETPGKDDVVVTWGSRGNAPYVAGVPIGTVEAVISSPREQANHAVVRPFVDFSAVDLVGVVVEEGTRGDRTVIEAGEQAAPVAGSSGRTSDKEN
jgi:rod shape-determining protein MreC